MDRRLDILRNLAPHSPMGLTNKVNRPTRLTVALDDDSASVGNALSEQIKDNGDISTNLALAIVNQISAYIGIIAHFVGCFGI